MLWATQALVPLGLLLVMVFCASSVVPSAYLNTINTPVGQDSATSA